MDWEKEINKLNVPMPEVGLAPPDWEIEKKDVDLDTRGDFSRLDIKIYFFVDKETGKTYTMSRHNLIDYEEVTLEEAIAEIKRQRLTKD